ncbi:MAG: hypothetical protein E2O95_04210 [Acidobacteria bacterium]|nr:MAG: hypothetical protein E2O95_04210 [Acidobacteriota bacterium]
MPTPEGTATTYDIFEAAREDLIDVITMISPTETPFFASISKGRAHATNHEWPTDELEPAVLQTYVEGTDSPLATSLDRVRGNNFTQPFVNTFHVSATKEAVDEAGVKSELAYQGVKKMKEHKRDIEKTFFSSSQVGVAGGLAAARLMKPIKQFISASTPDHRVAPGATPTADTKITEDDLNTGMEACWNEGGMVDTVFCSAKIKRRFSGFTKTDIAISGTDAPIQQDLRSMGVGERKLAKRIDVYEGDFGEVRIVANRFIPITTGSGSSTDVYILESQRWEIPFLTPTRIEDLAKGGPYMKKHVYSELTVAGRAEKGNFVFETVDNAI